MRIKKRTKQKNTKHLQSQNGNEVIRAAKGLLQLGVSEPMPENMEELLITFCRQDNEDASYVRDRLYPGWDSEIIKRGSKVLKILVQFLSESEK